jgi:chemotaxis protein MotB
VGKKKQQPAEAEKDTFMMMFVTLSLILLAFFILLNSLAVVDNEKKRMALGSLLGSFGIMPGGESSDSSREQSMKKASIISGDGMYKMFKEVKKEIDVILSNEDEKEGGLSATFDEKTGEIKIVLAERLLFPPGEAVVSIRLFSLLEKTANIAMRTGGKVVVTGHTDNRAGSRNASNWRLSMDRGIIVARHLEAVGPIPKGHIIASGASHYLPIRENTTEEGRAANRRVEIQIRNKEADF